MPAARPCSCSTAGWAVSRLPTTSGTFFGIHVPWSTRCPTAFPLIHFGTDTATLLELQAEAGASVIGVDHRMRIGEAFERFPNLAVQGNLDPVVLMADREVVRTRTLELLDEVGGRPGHIFNLGHGILPGTPVENVRALVDHVHEATASP